MSIETGKADALRFLTTEIIVAHVSNNNVPVAELPSLISSVHAALANLGEAPSPPQLAPAVSIRASVKPDYIICLEDGKRMKMLKRHLMTQYGMTPDEYREKWGLPDDYPMVALNYAALRSDLAKKIGLGRTPRR